MAARLRDDGESPEQANRSKRVEWVERWRDVIADEPELSGPVTISAEVDATVADYDNGASEDGDWAYLPYNEVTYLPEIEARVAIRMPFTRSKVGAIAEVTIEKPKDVELAGHRCRVRMRKHWSDGDGPDEPDVSTSDQLNKKAQKAAK